MSANSPSTASDISRDILIEDLVQKSATISAFIQKRGYPIQNPSSKVLEKMRTLATEELQNFLRDFTFLEEVIAATDAEQDSEKTIAQLVLKKTNLSLNESFWDNHDEEQIIEIYREDGVQIYRSFNIFKTTGYSLLDLSLHPWTELWERSSRSVAHLQSVAHDLLTGKLEYYAHPGPGEVIKEVLNTKLTEPFVPRSLWVTVLQGAACRDVSTDRIRAFVVTTTCRVLDVGTESEKISMI